MPTYLLKTEPSTYSFADLCRDKRTTWEGVANPTALIHLRAIRKGDELLIYHTGSEKAIVGLAKAITDAFEDPKQPGTTPQELPKFAVVDLAPVKSAKTPVTLAALKADKSGRFAEFALLKLSRLSVMPVPPAIDKAIRTMAGL